MQGLYSNDVKESVQCITEFPCYIYQELRGLKTHSRHTD